MARIYIAGKMTGMPYFNRDLFNKYAAQLREQGHFVKSPIEMDIEKYGPEIHNSPTGDPAYAVAMGFDKGETLMEDFRVIQKEVDTIGLLPGWQNSTGANMELNWAKYLNKQVVEL